MINIIDPIVTVEFWSLQKQCDHQLGVLGGGSNLREARVTFRRVMRAYGYVRGANRTWLKAGFAAVMEPR